MLTLTNLPKTTAKHPKRRGRGIGSGVGGHTTGRGAKGDKIRGSTKLTFDGTKIKKSWLKRTPFLRGKHRNLKRSFFSVFNLSLIDAKFKENSEVSPKTLNSSSVKILGGGNLSKPLVFKDVRLSQSARQKILASGGKIEA